MNIFRLDEGSIDFIFILIHSNGLLGFILAQRVVGNESFVIYCGLIFYLQSIRIILYTSKNLNAEGDTNDDLLICKSHSDYERMRSEKIKIKQQQQEEQCVCASSKIDEGCPVTEQ